MDRRQFLIGLGAAGVVGAATLTGCGSDDKGDGGGAETTAASSPMEGGAGGDVGVFTWWAEGSEKEGLDALEGLFQEDYPNDTFVNLAVAGGAGSSAKAKLAADLQNGNPPDSFQGHAGAELIDYIDAEQILPVNDVIDELGGADVFPQDLLDRITVDDDIYSVPSNVHRANVVWANPKVLADAGAAEVPADLDAWLADMQKIKDSGVETPITVGGTWTQVQLFETILLAELGVEDYNALFSAGADWESDGVKSAVEKYARILEFGNTASDGDDWPAAIDAVIAGQAAYNVMGDWAVAQFASKDQVDGEDYTYFPVPGTDGVFDFLADSFTLPNGASNEEGAKDWLRLVGSEEGQKAFNLAKGSIPARTDVAPDDFPPYQQSAMQSFKDDVIASSIAHGAAVSMAWLSDMSTAMSKFYSGRDEAVLLSDLSSAAQTYAI